MGRLINAIFALSAALGSTLLAGGAQAASVEELDAWNAARRLGSAEAYQPAFPR